MPTHPMRPRSSHPFLGWGIGGFLVACGSGTTDTASDTNSASPLSDFVRVHSDSEMLSEWGYTVDEWQLSDSAGQPYDSLFPDAIDESGEVLDYRPTFYALRPTDSEAEAEHLLVWLHGGGVADDRDFPSTGELPDPCKPEKITALVRGPINKQSTAIMAAVDAGWWMLFPRNDWCDAWLGQGRDDPFQPDKYGNHHLHRMLDFAAAGGLNIALPDERYLWGSSAGGTGALFFASGREDITALVVDSAPTDWVAYYGDDPEVVESHFGGPPYTEAGAESVHFEAYLRASGPHLVASGLLPQRVFVAWNERDLLIPPVHGTELVAALKSSDLHDDTHFGHKNFNRSYPEPNFHVQVSHPEHLPAASTQVALQDFLTGHQLTWLEAEDSCEDGCPVGVVVDIPDDSPEHDRAFSNQAARIGLANGVSGTLAEWRWTPGSATEAPYRFRFAAAMESSPQLEEEGLAGRIHITLSSGTVSKDVRSEDLHFSRQNQPRALLDHIAATTLEVPLPPGEEVLIQWEHTGLSQTRLDHLVISTPLLETP